MKDKTTYHVHYGEADYEVAFQVEHHAPPLEFEARHRGARGRGVMLIRATTTCVVRRVSAAAPAVSAVIATAGASRCSVSEPFYSFTHGCEQALDRAVGEMAPGIGAAASDMRREFRRQVMPPLAADHRERTRRSAPNELRALRKRAARLAEDAMIVQMIAREGSRRVFRVFLDGIAKSVAADRAALLEAAKQLRAELLKPKRDGKADPAFEAAAAAN